MKKKIPLFLSIEGNIGAGKSILLNLLKQQLNHKFYIFQEPLNEWKNIGNENINLLDLFYKDPKRWGYTFQSYAFYSRLKNFSLLKENYQNKDLIISERSIFSDNKAEYVIYKQWFEFLLENIGVLPKGIIYLNTNPDICYERCLKRARNEEKSIEKSYLEQIDKCHKDWLFSNQNKIPLVEVDGNKEFENIKENQKIIIDNINQFILKLQKSAEI